MAFPGGMDVSPRVIMTAMAKTARNTIAPFILSCSLSNCCVYSGYKLLAKPRFGRLGWCPFLRKVYVGKMCISLVGGVWWVRLGWMGGVEC